MNEPPKVPALPAALGPLWKYLNSLNEYLRSLRVTSVAGGELRHTSRGVQVVVNPAKRNAPAPAVGLVFRGEYTEAVRSQCVEGDVWVVMSGPRRGTYICLNSNPNRHPWEGEDWVCLPLGSITEQYL